jgi:hypothetical protein
MQRLWIFRPWIPYAIGLEKLVRHCSILNGRELFEAGYHAGRSRPDLPVARLKLTLKNFDTDCFMFESRTFVSERLRSAMALESSAVQFFDVDASQSAPVPRSMNYKIMVISVTEEASDPSMSNYISLPVPHSEISMITAERITVRPDFVPVHDLFHDRFFLEVFCTDQLAVRVLKAGCTGMRFFEPAQLSIAVPMRFRTLRGIEEEGEWDSVKKIEHTKLVEAIH